MPIHTDKKPYYLKISKNHIFIKKKKKKKNPLWKRLSY